MHLADGVLSMPMVAATSVAAGGILYFSAKRLSEEEMPKVGVLAAAFFVSSLISIPVGPSSTHPILGGLLAVFLGRRAPLAFFVGLVLQAVLFQHGGLTTLGANALSLSIPALLVALAVGRFDRLTPFLKGFLAGSVAIVGTVGVVVLILLLSDFRFAEGAFSVINVLVVSHIPLILIEGILTGAAVQFCVKARPHLLARVQLGG